MCEVQLLCPFRCKRRSCLCFGVDERQRIPVEKVELCWRQAAEHGHVNMLDWLLDNRHMMLLDTGHRYDLRDINNSWRKIVTICLRTGALNSHVNVLDWLLDNGHRLIPQVMSMALEHRALWNADVDISWHHAASNGHVHVLDWLLANGHSTIPAVMGWAARNGQISVL